MQTQHNIDQLIWFFMVKPIHPCFSVVLYLQLIIISIGWGRARHWQWGTHDYFMNLKNSWTNLWAHGVHRMIAHSFIQGVGRLVPHLTLIEREWPTHTYLWVSHFVPWFWKTRDKFWWIFTFVKVEKIFHCIHWLPSNNWYSFVGIHISIRKIWKWVYGN
jgi:hypothetical protein